MTHTTQKTKDTRITCTAKGCSKRFKPSRKGVKFCSDTCRTSCNNIKKARTTETTIPRSNHFCITLIDEAIRAGSLEVFTHLKGNVAALEATYKVVTARMRANIVAGVNSFHVCHVAPVMHATRLGTFDHTNLFVGASEKNKAASCTATGSGTFIAKASLNPVNDVADTAGRAATLDRIIAYIGEATFKAFVKKVKLKDSIRVVTVAKLEALVEVDNPEHSKYVALLLNKKTPTQELTSALAELSGKTPFKPSFSRVSEANMLIAEYVRHAAFRDELQFLLPHIAVAVYKHDTSRLAVTLGEDDVQCLFDLLQGLDAGGMEAAVDELIYTLHAQERQAAHKAATTPAVESFHAPIFATDEEWEAWYMGGDVPVYPSCRTLEAHSSDLSHLNPPF
jgi:hypothetical protein